MQKSSKIILIVIIILVIIGGFWTYVKFYKKTTFSDVLTGKSSISLKNDNNNYYYNFSGNYVFQVPQDYVVDDVTVPNIELVMKKDSQIQVNNVNEIYDQGVIAVQSFTPIINDKEAFKNYINNNLQKTLTDALKGEAQISFSTKNNISTAELKITSGTNTIRTEYIYNLQKPIVVAAKESSDQYKTITNSLSTIPANLSEIQTNSATIIYLIKNQMYDDIYRLSTKDLQSKTTLADFKNSFDKVVTALSADISASGAVYNNDEFTAVLLFTKPADSSKDTATKAIGTLSFKKDGNSWKVNGISLPSDDAFK